MSRFLKMCMFACAVLFGTPAMAVTCAPGTYYNGSTCVTCPAGGYFCAGFSMSGSVLTGAGRKPCPSVTLKAGDCPAGTECLTGTFNTTTVASGATSAADCKLELPIGYAGSNWKDENIIAIGKCPAGFFRGVADYTIGSSGLAYNADGTLAADVPTAYVSVDPDTWGLSADGVDSCHECAYFAYSEGGAPACKTPAPGYRATGCSSGGPGFLDCKAQEPCPAGTYLDLSSYSYSSRRNTCAQVPVGAYPTDCALKSDDGTPYACATYGSCSLLKDSNASPSIPGSTSADVCCADPYVYDEHWNKCRTNNIKRLILNYEGGETTATGEYADAAYYETYGSQFFMNYYQDGSVRGLVVDMIYPASFNDGREFVGWYTQPNGGGTKITDAEGNILVSNTFFTKDTNLYAYGDTVKNAYLFIADTTNVTLISPSISKASQIMVRFSPANNTYSMYIDGSAVGQVEEFPYPLYTSDSKLYFQGWYTGENGTGTKVTNETGVLQITPQQFSNLFTYPEVSINLYAYAIQMEPCVAGQYYNRINAAFRTCLANYYCDGTGYADISYSSSDPARCITACPSGQISAEGSTSASACHAPCGGSIDEDQYYTWDGTTCVPGGYALYMDPTGGYGDAPTNVKYDDIPSNAIRVSVVQKYGTGWWLEYTASLHFNYQISTFPVTTADDAVFMGWYTGQKGTGTQITDENGNILVSNTFFKPDVASGNSAMLYAKYAFMCKAGITKIKTGSGVTVPLYDSKVSAPALAVGYNGQVCYGELEQGLTSGAINIQAAGMYFHTK